MLILKPSKLSTANELYLNCIPAINRLHINLYSGLTINDAVGIHLLDIN